MSQPYKRLEDRAPRPGSRWRFLALIAALILLFFTYWTVDISGDRDFQYDWIVSQNHVPKKSEEPVTTKINTTVAPTVSGRDEVRLRKRPETAHVDCKRALNGEKGYLQTIASDRPVLKPQHLKMDCPSLRSRILPTKPLRSTSFGVAFARIDYEFIEEEVRSLFHSENLFCFILDTKATTIFKQQIGQLSQCFPNVLLVPKTFDVDGSGHNMNAAHLECLAALNKKPHWEYVLLLQNHDVVIRTPYELVAVYKEMRGANDVEITPCPEDRWNKTHKWDARSLKLFRNESAASPTQLNASIRFAKGAVQASLSRETVRWMIETVDLTKLVEQFNSMDFGVDEQLIQSLQITDELQMPGRFTHKCLDKGHNAEFVSRMSHWAYASERECATRTIRHAICLLGIDDIPSLSKYPHIMANKFLPDFDYAGVDCIHELIFNRTHLEESTFDASSYGHMVNVQYHKKRKENLDRDPPLECLPRKQWKTVMYP